MIAFAKMNYPIPYIPADRRYDLLPEHSICSIAPADITADDFITGNGTLRVESAGRPYDDEMAYTQELLYEPLREKTPLPPDLRPYLPRDPPAAPGGQAGGDGQAPGRGAEGGGI